MKSWPYLGTFDLARTPPSKLLHTGLSMWRLIAVSPKDTISFLYVWKVDLLESGAVGELGKAPIFIKFMLLIDRSTVGKGT